MPDNTPMFPDWDGKKKPIGSETVGQTFLDNAKNFTYSCEICGMPTGKAYNDICPGCKQSEMSVGNINEGEEIIIEVPEDMSKPFEIDVIKSVSEAK